MKRWTLRSFDREKADNIVKTTDLSHLTAEVMCARGYSDTESLVEFFDGCELSDPFLLTGMDKAVDTIYKAVDNGETICIYGDYDCDGVTSTAILYDYLLSMGADVICYIPERKDGYGLNRAAIDEIKSSNASLIITVDNGITAVDEAEYIASLGMKIVITDHHQPSETIPNAEAVVDPHLSNCPTPFKQLAGVGVTLKLLCALDDGNYSMVMEQYSDICAIGTIADVVPLVGENRTIVKSGLSLLKNTENLGLISLMENCGVNVDEITASTVAFTLSPRINAAGRFGSAMTALDLLTSDGSDSEKLAHELMSLNNQRRATEFEIMTEIEQLIASDPKLVHSRVIVVSGDNWHHGVIGIVAARLLESYERPVIVISKDADGLARGSARSIKGFNIFKCFEYCKELLIKYGGHECAGGLTVAQENIGRLNEMIQEYARVNYEHMPVYTICADKLLKGTDITEKNIKDLKRLEPYGAENPEPIFAVSKAKVMSVIPLKNGEHTKLEIIIDGVKLNVLLFKRKTSCLGFGVNDYVDFVGTLGINEYKGAKSFTMTAHDIRLHGIRQDTYLSDYEIYEAICRGEAVEPSSLARSRPNREELVEIYKKLCAINAPVCCETLCARLRTPNISCLKLLIAFDVFSDVGLIESEGSAKLISLKKADKRVDIMSARTIKHIDSLIEQTKAACLS